MKFFDFKYGIKQETDEEKEENVILMKESEDKALGFLLSLIRSIQRESIVIVKKIELQILTNLHVLDFPESKKHNFGIMSVCEHDYSKTIRATGMKFGM
ncbi:hypothetical protein AVEN_13001-1 [Araneus ventricosus]|uniref:Uncharacterized protein n=1 Tax=Araneus ventricosus TaxID=182803 RepID=A0A4Y2HLX8_ARAVE|nr:hypothetical protein AVEN_13001-1 [Araneus ventricosus]